MGHAIATYILWLCSW